MQKYETALCIPRIEAKFTRQFIFDKIRRLNWGYIEKINEIPLMNEENYKRIVVKLKWNQLDSSKKYKAKLDDGETIKLVYERDSPWYWRIHKFR